MLHMEMPAAPAVTDAHIKRIEAVPFSDTLQSMRCGNGNRLNWIRTRGCRNNRIEHPSGGGIDGVALQIGSASKVNRENKSTGVVLNHGLG